MDDATVGLRPGPGINVPVSLVRWRFDTAGGPGGQHANRTASRAEASLNFDEVEGVDASVMARWRARFGPVLRVNVGRSRSQSRNRELALAELERRLADALRQPRARRPTQPSRSAKRRRAEDKRRRSQTKAARRRPQVDE